MRRSRSNRRGTIAPHFDTGNEYSDTAFVDVEYGIRGGFKGHGFAETSVKRARFVRNTTAGIALGNFNALDLWVRYSLFEDCGVAVTNTSGAGNFHVYNSLIRRSKVADFSIENTGGFSVRDSYSVGSKAFFTAGGTSNPALIHLQRNTIIDPIDATSIRLGNQGPGLITDNVVRSVARRHRSGRPVEQLRRRGRGLGWQHVHCTQPDSDQWATHEHRRPHRGA